MLVKFLVRLIITIFIVGSLAGLIKFTQWLLIRGLMNNCPRPGKEQQLEKQSKDLVVIMSKEIFYYVLFGFSLMASLFADFLTQLCLVFTAIIAFMEAKSCAKQATASNQKLSRILKSGLKKQKK